MTLINYFTLSILLFFFIGLSLSFFLSTLLKREDLSSIAPALSVSVLIFLGWHSRWLFKLGTDNSAHWILTFSLLPWMVIVAFKRFRDQFRTWFITSFVTKDLIAAIIVAAITTVSLSWLALQLPNLGPLSFGNNDLPDYSLVERYLKEFSEGCTTGFVCELPEIQKHVTQEVFGAYWISAFLSSILSLQTYQTQTVFLLTFSFFIAYFSFFFSRNALGFTRLSASLVTVLTQFNPIFLMTLYHGYKSQILSMSLMVPLLGLADLISNDMKAKNTVHSGLKLLIPTSIVAFGISLTYPHMVLPLFALASILWVSQVSVQKGIWSLILLLLLGLGTSLGSWHRALIPISAVFELNQKEAGWFIPAFTLDRIFGFFYPLYDSSMSLTGFEHLLRSVPYLILILLSTLSLFKFDRKRTHLTLTIVGPVLIGYLYLIYKGQNNGQWGGYKGYKWLSFFLPVLIPCLFVYFKDIGKKKFHTHALPTLFKAFLLGIACFATVRSTVLWMQVRTPRQSFLTVSQDDAALQKIEQDPRISSINIVDEQWWTQMWNVNFLASKKLYLKVPTYFPSSPLQGEWTLEEKRSNWQPAQQETIDVNSRYRLRHTGPIPSEE